MTTSDFAPRPSDEYMSRDLGDEYLFYDRKGDRIHVLNGTARDIYLLCDGKKTSNEIAEAISDKYEVDPETARTDVQRTIQDLVRLGLLAGSE